MKARSDGATKRRSDGGDLGIVALTLLVLVGVASAQSLEELPGYERYRELTRATRTLATGGVVRDVNWTEDAVYFTAGGQRRRCDLATGEVADFDGDEPEVADEPDAARRRPARGRQRRIEPSPDGVWKAECRDDNVVLIDVDTGEELTLTTGGHRKHRFGRASWVYGEELRQREAMWWSPDSTKLAWYEFDETAVPDFILLSGLTDLRPETLVEGYPKPGEPNPVASLHVHDLATGETVRVDSGPHDGIGHYVFNVRFSPDGSSLIFSRTNRAQNILEVVAADPMTGAGRVLVRETQDTWQRNRPVMQFLTTRAST